MPSEIERKFLLASKPNLGSDVEVIEIEQGYLAIDGEVEVRVRRTDQERVLTVKGGRGEVREEIEFQLSEQQFHALWPLTDGRRMSKTRHLFPLKWRTEGGAGRLQGRLVGASARRGRVCQRGPKQEVRTSRVAGGGGHRRRAILGSGAGS